MYNFNKNDIELLGNADDLLLEVKDYVMSIIIFSNNYIESLESLKANQAYFNDDIQHSFVLMRIMFYERLLLHLKKLNQLFVFNNINEKYEELQDWYNNNLKVGLLHKDSYNILEEYFLYIQCSKNEIAEDDLIRVLEVLYYSEDGKKLKW